MRAPPLIEAIVSAQDPDNEAVFVLLGGAYGGQGPPISVQVGTQGPRDATVGRHPALPTQGTHGVVAFPRGDFRNGIWLTSISTQFTDASAHAPGNGGADYAAHYGGGWSWRGQEGTVVEAMPDGTILQLGPTMPAPTRHTVDGQQQRQRTPFTAQQRVPQRPTPFPVSITHPTGAAATLTAAGAWQLTAATGQPITLNANGATMTIDASGNLQIVVANTVTVNATTVNVTGDVVAGTVSLQHHVHINGGGTGNSGPPLP